MLLASSVSIAQEVPPLPDIPLSQPATAPPTPEFAWSVVGDVQGDASLATTANDRDVSPALLRRARFGAVLDYGFDWRLRASGDLGKFSGLRDLSVEYRHWPVRVSAGRLVEPFGLLQGSASGAALMERPAPFALAPGYGVGVSADYAGERWGGAIGAFKATQNSIDLGGRDENALTARITGTPIRTEDEVVHVGFSISQRRSGNGLAQFDALPETALLKGHDTESLVFESDSDSPGSNGYRLYGVEAAWRHGPILLKSEYLTTTFDHVNTRNPNTNQLEPIDPPNYSGYYIEGSWTITGELRDYGTRQGTFGNVYPDHPLGAGGRGAFEIAARSSQTDLRYDIPYHGPTGDLGYVHSLAVNWYATDPAKVMLEFLQIDRRSHGPVDLNGTHRNPSVRDWIVQVRLQWYLVLP